MPLGESKVLTIKPLGLSVTTGPEAHVLHGGRSLQSAHQQCFAWASREADVELLAQKCGTPHN